MENTNDKDNTGVCTGDTCSNVGPEGIDIPENNQSNYIDISHKTSEKPWLFKKGNTFGKAGRPKGKSLKEYTRERLASMTDEEREEFMDGLTKETIWKMAEGNPPTVIAGDKDNPLRIIAVDSEEALRYGITTSTPEDNTKGQE